MSAVAPISLQPGPRPLPAEATRLLYERHSGRIFGYCLSLLGSREEAEDAVQTTFMNVQRGLDRGVVPQFELAWLFKIARNVCYNRSESSSRRRRVESAHDLDTLQDVVATPERSVGLSIGELTRALGSIPDRQRRALLLREFQGMSSFEPISRAHTGFVDILHVGRTGEYLYYIMELADDHLAGRGRAGLGHRREQRRRMLVDDVAGVGGEVARVARLGRIRAGGEALACEADAESVAGAR